MPRQEVLDALYGSYYSESREHVTFHGIKRFARHLYHLLSQKTLPSPYKILDYGGGNGSITLALAKLLLDSKRITAACVQVVDYGEPCQEIPDGVRLSHTNSLDLGSETFHFVNASAVLEHIPFLHSTLAGLFKHVAPGGVFYARTPCVLPLRHLIELDISFPGHVHDLGYLFWNKVMETFSVTGKIVASRPAIVETAFSQLPLRTASAYMMKFPAHVEVLLRGYGCRRLWWQFVGGWEAALEIGAAPRKD